MARAAVLGAKTATALSFAGWKADDCLNLSAAGGYLLLDSAVLSAEQRSKLLETATGAVVWDAPSDEHWAQLLVFR